MPSSVASFGVRSTRSTTSIATTRSRLSRAPSRKSVNLKWYQRRPILANAYFIDLQKGSYLAAVYTVLQSILQLSLATFDIYCLIEAAPGSKHFRSFGISFLFVYSGNQHVRRALMASALILIFCSFYLLFSAVMLMTALRKEHELKFRHWLRAMAIFIVLRFITLAFQSTANDLYFGYHQFMLFLWLVLTCVNIFCWLVVYSNYQELSDITRLEDMAKLKMSTLSSLRSFSHHSLDSANPYGRYGGSVQASPQIYGHHNMSVMSGMSASQQNIPSTSTPQIPPKAPGSHHSSQNSLHQSYLQMYSNELSQRSRQSSQASLSINSAANSIPMSSLSSHNQPPVQYQHQSPFQRATNEQSAFQRSTNEPSPFQRSTNDQYSHRRI